MKAYLACLVVGLVSGALFFYVGNALGQWPGLASSIIGGLFTILVLRISFKKHEPPLAIFALANLVVICALNAVLYYHPPPGP